MQDEFHPVVRLCRQNDSVAAARLAVELTERRFHVDRSGVSDNLVRPADAFVDIVDSDAMIPALRDSLDRRNVPTLVLVTASPLVAAILPLLQSRQDLAVTTDSVDLIAWRLQRLIEVSSRAEQARSELDPLTELLNRWAIQAALQMLIEAPPPGAIVGLLMFDLDRFKAINDSFGHMAGDRALWAVGDALRRSVRKDDLVARVGGDEFVCVMVREDRDSIVHAGRRLLDEIADIDLASALARPTAERVTASAGVTWVRSGVKLESLLHEADTAMYAAKNAGRSRVVVANELAEAAAASSRDLSMLHFENSTRLATERFADMMAIKSRKLLNAATLEANTCPVTGLYSRTYLNTRLGREMAEARSQGKTLAVAFIDVDKLRAINATYGWPSGDRVLRAFADVVRDNLRSSDWAAKYGGDEFLLVFPDSALSTAEHVVERVREAFAAVTVESVDGVPVRATLSAGVAQMPERELSAEAFLNDVAKSLNKAKESGRNRVQSLLQSSAHAPQTPKPATTEGENAAISFEQDEQEPRARSRTDLCPNCLEYFEVDEVTCRYCGTGLLSGSSPARA